MTDPVRQQLDAIMEDASRKLVEMDYLTCERKCLDALAIARHPGNEDWIYYARILLPLQECRRQRRMIAAEGTIRLGTSDLTGPPTKWLERLSPGCVVVTPPHTADHARQLQQEARTRKLHVEVLFADNDPVAHTWRLITFSGRAGRFEMPRPPAESINRWLTDPADARRQDASDWFIDATEALGDALIATVSEPEGSRDRISQLEACVDAMTDHEKLHQRLADAARAMKPGAPAPAPAPGSDPPISQPSRSAAKPKRSGPSIGRIIRMIVLFLVVFTVLLGVGAYWMWSRVPAHWTRQLQQTQNYTTIQLQQMGQQVEMRINNTITQVDGPEIRTIEATIDEINAWLDQRARAWLANQNIAMPDEIGKTVFSVDRDQPVLSFELTTAEVSQIVSIFGRIELRDGGEAYFKVEKILGGELPIPAGMLVGHVEKSVPQQYLDRVQEFSQGLQGVTFDPIIPIDDVRQGRVLTIQITPDKVTMTVKVEPRQ